MYLWAALAVGALPGIAAGYALGWTRGHAAGVQAGKGSDDRWRAFLQSQAPDYQRLIPHGQPDHECSMKCRPPGPMARTW